VDGRDAQREQGAGPLERGHTLALSLLLTVALGAKLFGLY
jgi:hypothetical protein